MLPLAALVRLRSRRCARAAVLVPRRCFVHIASLPPDLGVPSPHPPPQDLPEIISALHENAGLCQLLLGAEGTEQEIRAFLSSKDSSRDGKLGMGEFLACFDIARTPEVEARWRELAQRKRSAVLSGEWRRPSSDSLLQQHAKMQSAGKPSSAAAVASKPAAAAAAAATGASAAAAAPLDGSVALSADAEAVRQQALAAEERARTAEARLAKYWHERVAEAEARAARAEEALSRAVGAQPAGAGGRRGGEGAALVDVSDGAAAATAAAVPTPSSRPPPLTAHARQPSEPLLTRGPAGPPLAAQPLSPTLSSPGGSSNSSYAESTTGRHSAQLLMGRCINELSKIVEELREAPSRGGSALGDTATAARLAKQVAALKGLQRRQAASE